MSPPDHQVEVFVPIWMQLRGGIGIPIGGTESSEESFLIAAETC